MTDPALPAWAESLRQIRHDAGNPPLRELAAKIDVPHSSVGNWFNGIRPRPGRLAALLDVLSDDDDLKRAVLDELTFDKNRHTYRKGRAGKRAYRWLQLLNNEIANSDYDDDIENLARRARVPVGVVEDILAGRYTPERQTIDMLVTALTASVEARALILVEYDEEVDQNLLEEINDPVPVSGPSPDAQHIAQALHELTRAVREGLQSVAEALRAGK